MIILFSSGDHLDCLLAGDSDACGGMLRFPGTPSVTAGSGSPRRAGAYEWARPTNPVGMAAVAAEGGSEADLVYRGGDVEDSFESEALRREAISTVAVGGLESLWQASFHGGAGWRWMPRGRQRVWWGVGVFSLTPEVVLFVIQRNRLVAFRLCSSPRRIGNNDPQIV